MSMSKIVSALTPELRRQIATDIIRDVTSRTLADMKPGSKMARAASRRIARDVESRLGVKKRSTAKA